MTCLGCCLGLDIRLSMHITGVSDGSRRCVHVTTTTTTITTIIITIIITTISIATATGVSVLVVYRIVTKDSAATTTQNSNIIPKLQCKRQLLGLRLLWRLLWLFGLWN